MKDKMITPAISSISSELSCCGRSFSLKTFRRRRGNPFVSGIISSIDFPTAIMQQLYYYCNSSYDVSQHLSSFNPDAQSGRGADLRTLVRSVGLDRMQGDSSRRSMDRMVPSEGTDAGSIPAERTGNEERRCCLTFAAANDKQHEHGCSLALSGCRESPASLALPSQSSGWAPPHCLAYWLGNAPAFDSRSNARRRIAAALHAHFVSLSGCRVRMRVRAASARPFEVFWSSSEQNIRKVYRLCKRSNRSTFFRIFVGVLGVGPSVSCTPCMRVTDTLYPDKNSENLLPKVG